jgi:Electron transfer DM13
VGSTPTPGIVAAFSVLKEVALTLDSTVMTVRKSSLVLAFVAVVVALVAGIFLFGRISDNAMVSMGLTALWFGLVFFAAAAAVLRRRELFWPLAIGYGAVAIAAVGLVIAPTLFDKEVDEQIVTGAPAGPTPAKPQREGDSQARTGPRGNVQIASGRFSSIAHEGTGKAAVVELPSGARKLTLSDFETDAGPDLRLYVSTGNPANGELGEFRDLGALKGNIGNQQYDLSRNVNLKRYSTVVVWCRAFSVAFTSAPLRRS